MSATASPAGAGRVSVLDVDAELRDLVPAERLAQARAALVATVHRFAPGIVDLSAGGFPPGTFALVAVRGSLMHEVTFADRELAELVLPGDVLPPWDPADPGLPTDRRFTALEEVQLVALDARFIRAASAWPSLLIAIHKRLNNQEHRVATHGVICQLPRVEQRIEAMMWHLAARVGKVGPEGTVIPFRITHEQLGRLVGARRPTVSLAPRELDADGRLRREGGVWILPGASEPDPRLFGAPPPGAAPQAAG